METATLSTGTASTTNGQGLAVRFALTVGSNFSTGTTNSWVTGNYATTSGAFNWINTFGATFYITGVQLEPGPLATSFDYRPYGTELALCQRYYALAAVGSYAFSGTNYMSVSYPVTMRATPTVTVNGGTQGGGTANGFYASNGSTGSFGYTATAEL